MLASVLFSLTLITPAQTGGQTTQTCPQYEQAIAKAGLPKAFSRIAYKESRCQPRIVSAVRSTGYPDVGLVQIQGSWRTVTRQVCKLKAGQSHLDALKRVNCNLAVAKYLFDRGGFPHWTRYSGK